MNTITSAPRPQATRGRTDIQTLRQTFVVNIKHGLHARPCALLIKTLRPFRSTVEIEANGERASGRSILGLMVLAARCGTKITFTITGEDALQAMAAVRHLFDTHFADAYRASAGPAKAPTAYASND